jgi:hypothetical protein
MSPRTPSPAKPAVPGLGFVGQATQTAAAQATFRGTANLREFTGFRRRRVKRARPLRRLRGRGRKSRVRARKLRGKLKKGSAAAKRHMARLRAMRRK